MNLLGQNQTVAGGLYAAHGGVSERDQLPERQPGPFHSIMAVQKELAILEDHFLSLASNLLGGSGELSRNASQQAPQAPGLFGAVEASAAEMLVRIQRMHAAIAAIERQLP